MGQMAFFFAADKPESRTSNTFPITCPLLIKNGINEEEKWGEEKKAIVALLIYILAKAGKSKNRNHKHK